MEIPSKRKNWTDGEDIMLLCQVSADMPFSSRRGSAIDSWEEVVAKFSTLDAFALPQFDGKKAQNRFFALMEEHRKYNTASATKSGVSGFYNEKHEVLDDLLAIYDEFEQTKASNAEKERKKRDDDETKGAKAREAAMVPLSKRKTSGNEESSQKEDKRNKYSGMMAEDTDKELGYTSEELLFRQKQFAASEKEQERHHVQFLKKMEDRECEREYQSRQREADRVERLKLAEMELQKTVAMLQSREQGKEQ